MSVFDPKLEKLTEWEQRDFADLLSSISSAQAKHDELVKQRRNIDREAAVYREALFGLGDHLKRRLITNVPIRGHLVEAKNGQKFLVEYVSLGSDRLTIRKDVTERVIVYGRILTTKGKLSTGSTYHYEYLANCKDLGPYTGSDK